MSRFMSLSVGWAFFLFFPRGDLAQGPHVEAQQHRELSKCL